MLNDKVMLITGASRGMDITKSIKLYLTAHWVERRLLLLKNTGDLYVT